MAKNNRTKILEIKEELLNVEEKLKALNLLTDKTDGRFQGVKTQSAELTRLCGEAEATKSRVDALVIEIEQKKAKANEAEESIDELVAEAEESKTVFDEHNKNLTEIEEKINKFEKEISEQLERAGAGTLAVAFAGRQGDVKVELERWRSHLYWATGILFFFALLFFVYSFFSAINFQFFLKLTVIFPLIYAVWFSGKQYNKERFILERYAFKSAQAKSLAAFSKTVQEMEPEDGAETSAAQQFVIDSVAKIYVPPKLESEDEDFPAIKIAEKLADTIKVMAKK